MGVVVKKAKEVLYTEEAEAFAKDLPRLSKVKLVAITSLLETQGRLNKPHAEKVEGQENLYAITIRTRDNPRVFYAYDTGTIDTGTIVWLLSGYYKKTQKIPQRELNRALEIRRKLGL